MADKSTADPRSLDVAAWCKAGREAQGMVERAVLPRLAEAEAPAPDGVAPAVAWTARGQVRSPVGREPEIRLHLQASTSVWLTCQRCLEPVSQVLTVDRVFRFVRDETLAEQLDEQTEDEDVLALPARLDLVELLEDELILAMPLVPMHERCPVDVAGWMAAGEAATAAEDEPHPFAALAALRTKPPTN